MEDQQQQQHQQQHQQQQQQQCQQELAKLRAIEAKVKQVQDKLTTRLPHQRSHLAAMVCGTTWVNRVRLAKQSIHSQEQYDQIVKKVRMELGAFDYMAKEQGELLTRYLCELDNILSFGNAEVKDARKALVVFIQSLLTTADEFRTKSAKLKEFGDKLMSTLPKPEVQHTMEVAADGASEAQTLASPVSEVEDVEMKPLFADDEDDEEDEDDDEETEAGEETDADEETEADEESGEEMSDGEEEDGGDNDESDHEEESEKPATQSSQSESHVSPRRPQPQTQQRFQHQQQKPAIDVRSLPVWRPYYQIQRRRDGLYLVASLRDIDPQNVRVQWIEHAGVLHISGHKLPTQKDITVSRFSGVPTFGRFEIAERLPANMVNMDEATQKVREDGTLEIRMPYYCMVQQQRQPRLFTRGSLFDAPRCMVW